MANDQAFLREIGRRLKAARLGAGMGLGELGERADVSRRYLTDTEAGRANPSLLVLVRIAQAVGLPLGTWLDGSFARDNVGRVALLGLRGAGKSTVGRELALALEAPFIELDEEVERASGLDLAGIFDLHGPSGYHRFEAEALERVLARADRLVIATGGSVVEAPKTFDRLLETCRTVWLRAEPTEHLERVLAQGDRRPVRGHPQALEELREILDRRSGLYGRCELHVSTSGRGAQAVVGELEGLLGANQA